MTDRELLELAAKAAGINGSQCEWKTALRVTHDRGAAPVLWNPLTDDGDALRLAVKLRLWVQVNEASVCIESWQAEDGETKELTEYFGEPDEVNAATRRVIVLAAAEIGKGLK